MTTQENYQSKAQEDKVSETEDSASLKNPVYPPLPEEAKGDRNLPCRVGFTFLMDEGIQRNFLRTDSSQLLWSFCHSQLKEEEQNQPFRAKLSNAMLSHAWVWIT